MEYWIQMIVTIICSVLASSGLWALIAKRIDNKDAKTELLLGIAHDRIVFLGKSYIERGYITYDEYENLYKYLYQPYLKLVNDKKWSNGTANKIINDVDKLPVRNLDNEILADIN